MEAGSAMLDRKGPSHQVLLLIDEVIVGVIRAQCLHGPAAAGLTAILVPMPEHGFTL